MQRIALGGESCIKFASDCLCLENPLLEFLLQQRVSEFEPQNSSISIVWGVLGNAELRLHLVQAEPAGEQSAFPQASQVMRMHFKVCSHCFTVRGF